MNTTLLTEISSNDHLPYPHSNGFADGGRSLVLGRFGQAEISLVKRNLETGKEFILASFASSELLGKGKWFGAEDRLWVDVAEKTNVAVTVAQNTVWIYDLNQSGPARKLFAAPEDYSLHALPGITMDGTRVVVVAHQLGRSVAWLIDVASGENHSFFESDWAADHFHFCPHDENWIGFSHEGACDLIPDRMWGWHRTLAPQGKAIFDQRSEDPQRLLCVGHERWCYHDTSALAVAYGVSPSGPRGLYEIFPDGRLSRLVSPGDRDWHCNVSRDGRWAVVDTTGPHDLPGKGWEGVHGESDVLLVDMQTGVRTFLAHSRSGKGQAHPHPVFSPDGRWIYFNNTNLAGDAVWIEKVGNPFS